MTSRQPSQPHSRQASSTHARQPSHSSRIPSSTYQHAEPSTRAASYARNPTQDPDPRRVATQAASRSAMPSEPATSNPNAVRRTLFSASAIRRPPSGASSRDDPFAATPAGPSNAQESRAQDRNEKGIHADPDEDIVARDDRGQIIVEVPGLSMLGAGPTMTPASDMNPGVGGGLGAALLPEEVEEERERERERRAIEMFWGGRERVDLGELKATLATSLQAKVASLDKDNWMFESEDLVPLGTQ